ncbi:MAG: hypothetical protein JW830_00235 [Bacteroidales bacterium]|nr:hypothetical protein [Bacteroidales bacterium]
MIRTRYITFLFLSAIALVMSHGIIPHHHCDDPCQESIYGHHPSETDHSEKPGKNPWHCQPYSHIVLIEQQLVHKFKSILTFHFEYTGDLVQHIFSRIESVIGNYDLKLILVIQKPLFYSSLLRAPPV